MFATGGHELGKLANNPPRPCQLDRLDSWLLQKRTSKLTLRVTMLQHPARSFLGQKPLHRRLRFLRQPSFRSAGCQLLEKVAGFRGRLPSALATYGQTRPGAMIQVFSGFSPCRQICRNGDAVAAQSLSQSSPRTQRRSRWVRRRSARVCLAGGRAPHQCGRELKENETDWLGATKSPAH
jgi:hypothetical protein